MRNKAEVVMVYVSKKKQFYVLFFAWLGIMMCDGQLWEHLWAVLTQRLQTDLSSIVEHMLITVNALGSWTQAITYSVSDVAMLKKQASQRKS